MAWLKTPKGQTLALLGVGLGLSVFSRFFAAVVLLASLLSSVRWIMLLIRENNPK
jgi:hypothetical protein